MAHDGERLLIADRFPTAGEWAWRNILCSLAVPE
jgi:hypothetical protein